MTNASSDIQRLQTEYAKRDIRLQDSKIYSTFNPSYLFTVQQRQRDVIDLLRRSGIDSLSDKRILEIGCGRGDVLHELLFHRIVSQQLHGVELLPDRLIMAGERFPGINLVAADGRHLPYPSGRFDLVMQSTVFSSILDETIKANIAVEMLRVLKPSGLVLWYDFWLNPTNPQTRGIRKAEIYSLFPNCLLTFRRITLAPPLTRKLVPMSWIAATILEKFIFLNTHYLVAIQPK